MIKISFVLKDQPDIEDIDRQREEAIMNGTRADLEEVTERIYRSMLREEALAQEQDRLRIEAEIARRRDEYIQEEENAERREAESQEDLIEMEDIPENEEEINEPTTEEEGYSNTLRATQTRETQGKDSEYS